MKLECSRLNAKNRVQAGEENLVVKSVKSGRKSQQKKNRNVVICMQVPAHTSVLTQKGLIDANLCAGV